VRFIEHQLLRGSLICRRTEKGGLRPPFVLA
jgi:hypothetical protein